MVEIMLLFVGLIGIMSPHFVHVLKLPVEYIMFFYAYGNMGRRPIGVDLSFDIPVTELKVKTKHFHEIFCSYEFLLHRAIKPTNLTKLTWFLIETSF